MAEGSDEKTLWQRWSVRRRARDLVLKPLSTPFLPLFGLTKMFEPGASAIYWATFSVVTGAVYAVGVEVQRRLDDVTD